MEGARLGGSLRSPGGGLRSPGALLGSAAMALLTALPFDDAQSLLSAYGIVLDELKPLVAGSVNSNFFLNGTTKVGGRPIALFGRIYEEQGEAGARFELQLNQVLKAAAIPVASVLSTQAGDLTLSYGGKPFALYERLDGEVTCQARVNPAMTRSVGAALAAVHSASLGSLRLPESRFGFSGIEERLKLIRDSGREDLAPAAAQLAELCDQMKRETLPDVPRGLIHGDLFRDNVLLRGDAVAGLLDFESASRGSFVFDLMVTTLAWCFGEKLDPALVRALLEGYDSVRALHASERTAMVAAGSTACVRFASTRLTDFSLRVERGQTPARDYRRFLQRLESLRDGTWDAIVENVSWRQP